jgi:hypothetical protein
MWLRSAAWRKFAIPANPLFINPRHTISRFENIASLVIYSFNAVESFSESLLVFIGYNLVD